MNPFEIEKTTMTREENKQLIELLKKKIEEISDCRDDLFDISDATEESETRFHDTARHLHYLERHIKDAIIELTGEYGAQQVIDNINKYNHRY